MQTEQPFGAGVGAVPVREGSKKTPNQQNKSTIFP